jgi:hypothetical protein
MRAAHAGVMGGHEPESIRFEGSEGIRQTVRSGETVLVVTTSRVMVIEDGHTRLDVPFEAIRRLQFDIERSRPATLVIVPDHPADSPQVVPVPREQYSSVADALVTIGDAIASTEDDEGAA